MRNIAAITMKELRTYFRTPIAYVIIALFLSVTGWFFFFGSKFFMRSEAEMRAFFEPLPWIFLLFIPAITMRLWSEEKKAGTIEVLFTMPVRSYEAVLGKFFGAVILLAIMLALSFAIPAIVAYVGDPDPGPIWGGYIGSLLLGSAYIALGLFASSLTENQIIAFIAAVVMGFFFFILDNTGLENVFPSFIKTLSLNYHFESVGRGVLDLRDIVYYLSFIGFFLILNASILRGLRQSAALTVGLSAALLILLNVLVSPVRARVDLTEAKLYTLHQDTKSLLGRVGDDLNVRVYMTPSEDMPAEFATLPRDIRDSLDEFQAFSNGRLKVKFVNTSASEEAKKEAEKAGIYPQHATVFGASEMVQKEVFLGMVVEYGDRSEVLPFADPRTIEYDLDVAISKVTRTKQPQIAFNVTNSIPDNIPPQFRAQLQAQNPNQDKHDVYGDYAIPFRVIQSQFGQKNVRTLKLDETVPPEVETLIVANAAGIDDVGQFYLDQFLMRGGRLMVLVDGASVDMSTFRGMPADGKLDPLFNHYGFKIAKDIVLDEQCATARIPGQRRGMMQFYQAVPYPVWVMATDIAQEYPVSRGFKSLLMPFSSSIELSPPPGVEGSILVRSSPKSWKQENTFFLSPQPELTPPADGKGMMQFNLVGLLSGKWKSYYADHPLPEALAPKAPETGANVEPGKEPAAQAKEKSGADEPSKGTGEPSKSDGGTESKPDGGGEKPPSGGPRVQEQEQDVPGGGILAQDAPPAQEKPQENPPQPAPQPPPQTPPQPEPPAGEATPPLVLPGDEPLPGTPEVKPEKKPVEVIKESKEPSTILVVGNSNFIGGQYAEQNAQFFLNAAEYLTVGGELLGVRSRQTPSRKFEKLDTAKINLLNYTGTALVPVLTVLFGFLFYIYRRNVRRAKVSL